MNVNQAIHLRPPRIAMAAAAIAALVHLLVPVTVHQPLPIMGVLAGTGGFLLMIRAWWLFRQSGTAICPTAPSTVLVTKDVFRLTRNPMYLGIAAMVAAPGLATGSPSFYLAAMAFIVIVDRVFCRHEEQKAIAEFGATYRQYARSVRRWL